MKSLFIKAVLYPFRCTINAIVYFSVLGSLTRRCNMELKAACISYVTEDDWKWHESRGQCEWVFYKFKMRAVLVYSSYHCRIEEIDIIISV